MEFKIITVKICQQCSIFSAALSKSNCLLSNLQFMKVNSKSASNDNKWHALTGTQGRLYKVKTPSYFNYSTAIPYSDHDLPASIIKAEIFDLRCPVGVRSPKILFVVRPESNIVGGSRIKFIEDMANFSLSSFVSICCLIRNTIRTFRLLDIANLKSYKEKFTLVNLPAKSSFLKIMRDDIEDSNVMQSTANDVRSWSANHEHTLVSHVVLMKKTLEDNCRSKEGGKECEAGDSKGCETRDAPNPKNNKTPRENNGTKSDSGHESAEDSSPSHSKISKCDSEFCHFPDEKFSLTCPKSQPPVNCSTCESSSSGKSTASGKTSDVPESHPHQSDKSSASKKPSRFPKKTATPLPSSDSQSPSSGSVPSKENLLQKKTPSSSPASNSAAVPAFPLSFDLRSPKSVETSTSDNSGTCLTPSSSSKPETPTTPDKDSPLSTDYSTLGKPGGSLTPVSSSAPASTTFDFESPKIVESSTSDKSGSCSESDSSSESAYPISSGKGSSSSSQDLTWSQSGGCPTPGSSATSLDKSSLSTAESSDLDKSDLSTTAEHSALPKLDASASAKTSTLDKSCDSSAPSLGSTRRSSASEEIPNFPEEVVWTPLPEDVEAGLEEEMSERNRVRDERWHPPSQPLSRNPLTQGKYYPRLYYEEVTTYEPSRVPRPSVPPQKSPPFRIYEDPESPSHESESSAQHSQTTPDMPSPIPVEGSARVNPMSGFDSPPLYRNRSPDSNGRTVRVLRRVEYAPDDGPPPHTSTPTAATRNPAHGRVRRNILPDLTDSDSPAVYREAVLSKKCPSPGGSSTNDDATENTQKFSQQRGRFQFSPEPIVPTGRRKGATFIFSDDDEPGPSHRPSASGRRPQIVFSPDDGTSTGRQPGGAFVFSEDEDEDAGEVMLIRETVTTCDENNTCVEELRETTVRRREFTNNGSHPIGTPVVKTQVMKTVPTNRDKNRNGCSRDKFSSSSSGDKSSPPSDGSDPKKKTSMTDLAILRGADLHWSIEENLTSHHFCYNCPPSISDNFILYQFKTATNTGESIAGKPIWDQAILVLINYLPNCHVSHKKKLHSCTFDNYTATYSMHICFLDLQYKRYVFILT